VSVEDQTISVGPDVLLGKGVRLARFINLYGCRIGDDSRIGAFVEIQQNATIGCRCKISSHSFICEGVLIEDEVFIGHGVTFINDKMPRATNADGTPKSKSDWVLMQTIVHKGAAIGSGSTILGNVTIGAYSMIGAGSVVVSDVPEGAVVAGNPARVLRYLNHDELAHGATIATT
jgi:acetyltransferase-like isoleucine patch superfamily enzyme